LNHVTAGQEEQMHSKISKPGGLATRQGEDLGAAAWSAIQGAVCGYLIIADTDRKIWSMNRAPPGRTKEHFLNRDFADFTFKDQRPMVIDAANRALADGTMVEIDTTGSESGRRFRSRISGIRDKGITTGFVVHVMDVEDTRMLEHDQQVLRSRIRGNGREYLNSVETGAETSQRWFESIADALPVLIAYVDKDRRYQYNNAAYCHWFGVSAEDIRGRALPELLGPETYELIRGYVDAVLAGHPVWFEQILPYKGAGVRHVTAHYVPDIDSQGNVNGFFALIEDVSARKSAEDALRRQEDEVRQLQKMEALGQLAGGIAHDFNNLLQTITVTCAVVLMRLGDRDTLISDDVARIKKVAENGAYLTRQLLAFSRRDDPAERVTELDAVLTELDMLLERLLDSNVQFQSDHRSCCHVVADVAQIQQIIMNLVINARDAMPEGGTLRLASSQVVLTPEDVADKVGRKPGRYAMVSVADTGTGMGAETIERIFEPFFTTKPRDRGTGLGLSMVYGIVTKLQGFIEVDSTPGAGTTFRLYLPCVGITSENLRGI
jgi:PAS domain S-box-containing protein